MAYDATDFIAPTITKPIDYKAITDPRERLVALSGFLRGLPPERFNMEYFAISGDSNRRNADVPIAHVLHDCGTAACICGWTNALYGGPASDAEAWAGEALGLGLGRQRLFWPGTDEGYSATPTQAANVIDHYLAHGVIDWGKA